MQSSHGCKLNKVAWVVKLTYLHVVVKCESSLGGYSKARCTVKSPFRGQKTGYHTAFFMHLLFVTELLTGVITNQVLLFTN